MKTTVKLDSRESTQVIDNAVRTQAQIVLESAAWDQVTLNGFLISGDEQALLLELTGKPKIRINNLAGNACQAQLYADQRYVFETKITATPQWGATLSIAIERPNQVRVLDRRRFARAKLAQSSAVKLEWTHDGLARRYSASLLNISPDGLACRVDAAVADAIEAGDILLSRFELPPTRAQFEIEASVLNKTPTGDGPVILGLQFARSQRYVECLQRLRQTLSGRIPAANRTESHA